jgi:excisionase family DNA binding protein
MRSTWLTPPQIAALLGIAVEKPLAWIRAGELPACDLSEKQGGRPRWRIDPADLQTFLSRRRNQAPAPRAKRRRVDDVPDYV